MPFDFGNATGHVLAGAQPTMKKTDLSPHVDGGQTSTASARGNASPDAVKVLHIAAAYVLLALLLLWITGTLVLRGARL